MTCCPQQPWSVPLSRRRLSRTLPPQLPLSRPCGHQTVHAFSPASRSVCFHSFLNLCSAPAGIWLFDYLVLFACVSFVHVRCLSITIYFACHNISYTLVPLKLATNIHHVSGHFCWKGFQGWRSKVKVMCNNHLPIVILELAFILTRGRRQLCTNVWMLYWQRHTFWLVVLSFTCLRLPGISFIIQSVCWIWNSLPRLCDGLILNTDNLNVYWRHSRTARQWCISDCCF